MTPEAICEDRPIRTINVLPGTEIIYDADNQPAVFRVHNDRGPMEVFVTSEKKQEALPILTGSSPMKLTGFFRRRSGFREDGSRHFIWCLILFRAENVESALLQAA